MWKIVESLSLMDYEQSMKKMNQYIHDQQAIAWFLEYKDTIVDGSNTGRGGGQIYHGPGQRVIYLIAPLHLLADNIALYIAKIEDWIINTCLALDITNVQKRLDGPGVWINGKKVAFIGVRVDKNNWVSHGIAININVDLSKFYGIDVCNKGIVHKDCLSIGNVNVNMNTFDKACVLQLQQQFPLTDNIQHTA